MRRMLGLGLVWGMLGCSGAGEPGGSGPPGPTLPVVEVGAPLDATFAARAREIASQYKAWGRVDDELRWAPFLCRQPMPASAHVSASGHADTHAQKLYSVFVRDRERYPADSQVGQVVVKESFVPERVDQAAPFDQTTAQTIEADHFHPYVVKYGVTYRAGAPAGLFVMFKLSPTTVGTDRGWVYATVNTAGEVSAAGRIASCMTCHEDAEHDRLFGVQTSPY